MPGNLTHKAKGVSGDDQLRAAWLAMELAEHRVVMARRRLERLIVAQHHAGATVSDIARQTHQSRAAVYKILHRHNAFDPNTHKEVEDDTEADSAQS